MDKDRMQRLRERRQKAGLKRLEVWAPESCHQRIKDYAKKVQKGAK